MKEPRKANKPISTEAARKWQTIIDIIIEEWKAVATADRAPFKAQAAEDRERHEAEMASYVPPASYVLSSVGVAKSGKRLKKDPAKPKRAAGDKKRVPLRERMAAARGPPSSAKSTHYFTLPRSTRMSRAFVDAASSCAGSSTYCRTRSFDALTAASPPAGLKTLL